MEALASFTCRLGSGTAGSEMSLVELGCSPSRPLRMGPSGVLRPNPDMRQHADHSCLSAIVSR